MQNQKTETNIGDIVNMAGVFAQIIGGLTDANTSGRHNLFLGGSAALVVHGLTLGRPVDDLDIIVFQPTEEQIKYVKYLEPFLYRAVMAFSEARSFKFKRRGFVLNILFAKDTCVPDYAPSCGFIGQFGKSCTPLMLNAVCGIIAAKNSYTFQYGSATYGRRKDAHDLQQLKNLNFNNTLADENPVIDGIPDDTY